MRYRPLGPSGIEASVVGLGTWAIGGWMWGGTEPRAAVETIHAALDAGVNLIDTAPIYGFGLSESLVGQAIRDRRERVVLATKCGLVANPLEGEPKFNANVQGPDPDGHIEVRVHNHPDSIQHEVEASLRRLRTDYIDLYQTHWQEQTTPVEDTMAALLELKDQGKIRAIGVCNASSDDIRRYRKIGPLDADQEPSSMLDRDIERTNVPLCREHQLACLAYSPLAQGLLTGKIGPERAFRHGDLRRGRERFSLENRQRINRMLESLKPLAQAHGASLGQLAIAWTLHQPGITHALCGARRISQAHENAGAGDITLRDEERRTVEEAIDHYTAALA